MKVIWVLYRNDVTIVTTNNYIVGSLPSHLLTHEYGVAVVGGGPSGVTAALYTTHLGHETALIDRGGGRAAMMLDTHNVIGVIHKELREFSKSLEELADRSRPAEIPIPAVLQTLRDAKRR